MIYAGALIGRVHLLARALEAKKCPTFTYMASERRYIMRRLLCRFSDLSPINILLRLPRQNSRYRVDINGIDGASVTRDRRRLEKRIQDGFFGRLNYRLK